MSFYVTTPIYYVNGEPHLGHAYSTIAADILARHMRQRGEDVFFLTGTDEHGEPVAQEAEREGVTPRELGDRYAPRFKEMAAKIEASNDFFIRTTDQGHMDRVQVLVRQRNRGHGTGIWIDQDDYHHLWTLVDGKVTRVEFRWVDRT